MEVRIGVAQSPKEIEVELDESTSPDDVMRMVAKAIEADDGVLWLSDRKGRKVGIPADRVAYVEIGSETDRRVGFGAGH